MEPNSDFRDLFVAFNEARAEYLVVGAHAVAAYGHVRATKDLDVWVRPTRANAARVHAALREFGAPLQRLSIADLAEPDLIYQIGIEPVRIDILTSLLGVRFETAWRSRKEAEYAGEKVHVLSRAHLLRNKRAVGRPQDLADVAALTAQPRSARRRP